MPKETAVLRLILQRCSMLNRPSFFFLFLFLYVALSSSLLLCRWRGFSFPPYFRRHTPINKPTNSINITCSTHDRESQDITANKVNWPPAQFKHKELHRRVFPLSSSPPPPLLFSFTATRQELHFKRRCIRPSPRSVRSNRNRSDDFFTFPTFLDYTQLTKHQLRCA